MLDVGLDDSPACEGRCGLGAPLRGFAVARGREGWVAPLYTRLAMGSTHAEYIVGTINLTHVGRVLVASRCLPYLGASLGDMQVWECLASSRGDAPSVE